MYRFLRYVPKNHLSRTVGHLVHTRLPRPIARRLVRWFADTYQIDVDAAGRHLHDYPSIGHFFIRDLREGLRPVESDFVSPVDGKLRNFGTIEKGRIEQVKGKSYTVERFLGDPELARRMRVFRNHGITIDHRERERAHRGHRETDGALDRPELGHHPAQGLKATVAGRSVMDVARETVSISRDGLRMKLSPGSKTCEDKPDS